MMKRIFYILFFVFLMASCSTPLNKERYLKNFETFLSEVSENYKNYSDKDWKKETEKFEKFSGVWYEKFKDEFTWQEKLKIMSYQAKFQYYSALSQTSSFFDEMLKSLNVQEIKATVQHYINNGLVDDLNQLYKKATEAGAAAEKVITEILNELKINIEELQKR